MPRPCTSKEAFDQDAHAQPRRTDLRAREGESLGVRGRRESELENQYILRAERIASCRSISWVLYG